MLPAVLDAPGQRGQPRITEVNMLRLVHPATAGQGPGPSKRRSPSPSLSLTSEEVRHFRAALCNVARAYGSIAFYLEHKAEIDKYLGDAEREFEANSIPLSEENPALWEKLQRARAKIGESRP